MISECQRLWKEMSRRGTDFLGGETALDISVVDMYYYTFVKTRECTNTKSEP